MKHLLSVADLSGDEIAELLSAAADVKASPEKFSKKLEGKNLVLLFEKPSTRTRISFQAGASRLGGTAIYFDLTSSQLARGESKADTIRTLSRYADAVAARVMQHDTLTEYAEHASVPVINALSDLEHPCQILADLLTMKEAGKLGGKIVYLGDGNNVCNSLSLAAEILGLDFVVSCPEGKEPKLGSPKIEHDPAVAAEGADVLYTDVWISMGEEESGKSEEEFKPYQLNGELLAKAKADCIVMHCLPAHRGHEITGDVIDGKNSVVFDQAENRMHAQNALLVKLLSGSR